MPSKTISNGLIKKLSLSFFLLILLMGATYVVISTYLTNKYFEESLQKLNSGVARHLIEEKFKDSSPFLEDGAVNKPLFGDIMHDMMAVNRAIEVYLLDDHGSILYSVVLDHSNSARAARKIDMVPVKSFIASPTEYILGDDPRTPGKKKIFSAAPFSINGKEGYIYIVLAGKAFEEVTYSRFSSLFVRLSVGATLLTVMFAAVAGFISIWFLTKNLRDIIYQVKRFQDGDIRARIVNAEQTDLSLLATSFNEMADTIVNNIEELQSVDKLRQELIANVSHDLRTPLAILQGYIETLQIKQSKLSEKEVSEYLGIIQNSSEKLSYLIKQLFEYSKLEAKQVIPNHEPFQLADLIFDVRAKYKMLAEKKNITLLIEAENEIPMVFADISLVERVIQNLMDNALKFTPANGSVKIAISKNQSHVNIAIVDSGPGIPKAEQSYIFERYRQSKTHHKSEGAGIGLAIVKKILEIHNSTIRVISQPNVGTTFQFHLPVYTLNGVSPS